MSERTYTTPDEWQELVDFLTKLKVRFFIEGADIDAGECAKGIAMISEARDAERI